MSNYFVYIGDGFGGNYTYGKKYKALNYIHPIDSSNSYINIIDDLGESQIVPIVEKDIEYFITIDEWRDRLINNIIK